MGKRIQIILKAWKEESGVTRVIQFRYNYSDRVLTIYTSQPGWLIGRGGDIYKKYNEILKQEIRDFNRVDLVETDYYWV